MAMNNLDEQLAKLKQYSVKQELSTLNKMIMSKSLPDNMLSGLSKDRLNYIHVRLHASHLHPKPFAKFEEIKHLHDSVIKFLPEHHYVNELDK
jgi:hypothetical protein